MVDEVVVLPLVEEKVGWHVLASHPYAGKGWEVFLLDELDGLARDLGDEFQNVMDGIYEFQAHEVSSRRKAEKDETIGSTQAVNAESHSAYAIGCT